MILAAAIEGSWLMIVFIAAILGPYLLAKLIGVALRKRS
jgi:hypothetical protein